MSLKYDFSNGWMNSGLMALNTNLEPNPILPIVDGLGWIFSISRREGRDFVKGPINTNLNYKVVSKKEFSGNFVAKNLLNGTEFGIKINQNEQEDLMISTAEIRYPFGRVKTYKIRNDLKSFFTIAEKLTVLFDSEAHSDLARLAKRYILNKFKDTVDYKISYKEDCVCVWLALVSNFGNPLYKRYNEYKLMDAEFCSNRALIKFGEAKEIPIEKHLVTSKYNITLNYNPVDNWTDKMGAVGTINFDREIIQFNAFYVGLIGSIAFYGPNRNVLEIHFNTNHYNNWNEKMVIDLVSTNWLFGTVKFSMEYLNQNGETNAAFKFIDKNTEHWFFNKNTEHRIFEASLTERVITNHAATYLCLTHNLKIFIFSPRYLNIFQSQVSIMKIGFYKKTVFTFNHNPVKQWNQTLSINGDIKTICTRHCSYFSPENLDFTLKLNTSINEDFALHFKIVESTKTELEYFEMKTSMSQEDAFKFELLLPNLNESYFTIYIRDALSCQNNPGQLILKSSFVGSQFLFFISDCIKLDKQAKILIEIGDDAKQILQKGLSQVQRSFGEYFNYRISSYSFRP